MKLTKKWLKKNSIPFEEKEGRITVFGSLDLSFTNITSLPENLVVGGWMFLDGAKIMSLPENMVVGGSLDLRGTDITSLPENLVVGGSLYFTGISKKEAKKVKRPKGNVENLLSWQNGKYRIFDGIFCEVLCKKKNVWKVKIQNKVQFVVTDGERFAHGETIEKARDSLMYKIGERDTSAYEHLNKNSVLMKEEAIKMYRVITGACESGTRHFVETNSDKIKDTMTIADIIKITEGQYGNEDLKKFFV